MGHPGSLPSCSASSCAIQLAMCIFKMDDFTMDALAVKAEHQAPAVPGVNRRNQVSRDADLSLCIFPASLPHMVHFIF